MLVFIWRKTLMIDNDAHATQWKMNEDSR